MIEYDEKIISMLLHEMRNPINILLGIVDQAKKRLESQVYIENSLDRINSVANYLLSLSNNYLDILKNEKLQLSSEINAFELNDLIEYIKSLFEFQANIKNIAFKVYKNSITNISILSDEIIIKQILINLLSNAFKFTPQEGIVSLTCKSNYISKDLVELVFIVTDTGVGMDEKFLNRLFLPFNQEQELVIPNGTGLGLSIVKEQVDKLNGTILVRSEPNKGTTFTVKFNAKLMKPDYDFSGCKILLVDDCDITKAVLKDYLSETGAFIDTANDGRIGLNMFLNSPESYYSTIILDNWLGYMRGDEVARKIRISGRSDAKTVKILGISSSTLKSDYIQSIESGMNEYLVKPICKNTFLQTLQKFINDKV